MRTKLLLGAAAALALGIGSTMAQTTYSQNVVGYINTVIPANSYVMMGNTLINGSDANQTNNDISTMVSGLISTAHDGGTSSNTVLYLWNGGYTTWYFYNSADALANGNIGQAVQGWYDTLGDQLTASVPQGSAIFLKNVFSGPITATLTGNVQQGTNSSQVITVGYNQISLQVPVATNLFAAGFGLPTTLNSTSNDTAPGHDILYYWNNGYTTWWYYNATDANNSGNVGQPVADFYDSLGNELPAPPVNAGLFLYHVSGSPIPFTTVFNVQ